jgi:hypothetical protein
MQTDLANVQALRGASLIRSDQLAVDPDYFFSRHGGK